jgi:hypothetical protein
MSRRRIFALGACLALSPVVSDAAERNAASATAFNPKISLILDSLYSEYSSDAPAEVAGVLLGGESDFAPGGFSLGETELVAEANVDDQWHGWVTVALVDGEAEVEEAYANTLALPWGFAAKIGRFKSDIGYQNHIHAHAWDFVDAPIVYRALLGGQFQDDGAQVRWVAPTDLLLEIGAEATRGDAFPAGGDDRSGLNAATGFLHLGGDVGAGGSWRFGLSHLRADADNRVTGEAPDDAAFTGKSDLSIADLVFKWAPGGNVTVTNLIVNAEYFHRDERGSVVFDPSGASILGTSPSDYDGKQQGYYVQAAYQFVPRWRAGLRYDWMRSDNTLATPAVGNPSSDRLTDNSYDPQRTSAMVDFSNSEFSRIRVQYNLDASRPGGDKDDQFFVQFVYSLGSHPAHQF